MKSFIFTNEEIILYNIELGYYTVFITAPGYKINCLIVNL
jgi:hypothetical protein